MKKFDLDAWFAQGSEQVFTPEQLFANVVAHCHAHYLAEHTKIIKEKLAQLSSTEDLATRVKINQILKEL